MRTNYGVKSGCVLFVMREFIAGVEYKFVPWMCGIHPQPCARCRSGERGGMEGYVIFVPLSFFSQ